MEFRTFRNIYNKLYEFIEKYVQCRAFGVCEFPMTKIGKSLQTVRVLILLLALTPPTSCFNTTMLPTLHLGEGMKSILSLTIFLATSLGFEVNFPLFWNNKNYPSSSWVLAIVRVWCSWKFSRGKVTSILSPQTSLFHNYLVISFGSPVEPVVLVLIFLWDRCELLGEVTPPITSPLDFLDGDCQVSWAPFFPNSESYSLTSTSFLF